MAIGKRRGLRWIFDGGVFAGARAARTQRSFEQDTTQPGIKPRARRHCLSDQWRPIASPSRRNTGAPTIGRHGDGPAPVGKNAQPKKSSHPPRRTGFSPPSSKHPLLRLCGTQRTFDVKRHTRRASPDRGMAMPPPGAVQFMTARCIFPLNSTPTAARSPARGAVWPLSADLAGANRLPGSGLHSAFGLSPCKVQGCKVRQGFKAGVGRVTK